MTKPDSGVAAATVVAVGAAGALVGVAVTCASVGAGWLTGAGADVGGATVLTAIGMAVIGPLAASVSPCTAS
ncbi:MAG: hypothetical protein AAB217_07055 [Chloroflexota bacterium]